jgi:D-3-phosphoglycerate dehydrogenase / 2-oxoglutarate reductase
MKVAITTSSFANFSRRPMELLNHAGFVPILNPHGRKMTEGEVVELLSGCVGVVAGTEPLSREVLCALPDLKVISRCGSGMDNVNHEAAKERGIIVCNTPFGPTLAVAELTLALTLSLLRKIPQMDREFRAGIWNKCMGNMLFDKTLGIIGLGRIGQTVAKVFSALGVKVVYSDPAVNMADWEKLEIIGLLECSDIVSFHCSMSGKECSVYTREHLERMKPGSWVINASRGGVVDENALYELLKSGHLAGAALDVFEQEPYSGPLMELNNVILTPHIGSYARESRIQMEVDAVRNLIDSLKG